MVDEADSGARRLVLAHGRERARLMLEPEKRPLADIAAEVMADEDGRMHGFEIDILFPVDPRPDWHEVILPFDLQPMASEIEESDHARPQLPAEGLNSLAHTPEIRIAQEHDGKAHLFEGARHIGGVVHGIR